MISGLVTPECALGVLRGEGIAPLISPPRRVLVVVDAVLVISILWLLLAPIWPVAIGPSSGYQEPDLDRTLREQAGASAEVGTLPRPWMSNATRGRAIGGKRKQHKKKKWKKRRQGQWDEEDEMVAAAAQSQAPSEPSCVPKAEHRCVANGRRVVVTLSIGKRSHFGGVRPSRRRRVRGRGLIRARGDRGLEYDAAGRRQLPLHQAPAPAVVPVPVRPAALPR